jgi:ribosomal-protein-alanine N-acetyltransferase
MAPEDKTGAAVPFQIRDFRASDAVRVSEILRDSAEAAQWPTESYTKLADSPGSVFLVCEAGARLIGFLAAREVVDEAEILSIAVSPDFRRKGVASALLLAAFDKFRRSEIVGVFLELRESNLAARALYERYGFAFSSRRKSYYRDPTEDALCMEKKLTRAAD